MTVSVTMIATRMGEDGDYWESGTSHDATDGFARYLVQYGWASATFPMAEQSAPVQFMSITAAQVAAGAGVEGQSYLVDSAYRVIFSDGAFRPWGNPCSVLPSGDTTGYTDHANLTAAFAAAVASGQTLFLSGSYVIHDELAGLSNLHIQLAPGTTITMRDSLLKSCTLQSSTTVLCSDTTGIIAGMLVHDEAGDLDAGTPFGGVPYYTKVGTVTTNVSFTITNAATTSGAATLRISPFKNCIVWDDCSNWSMVCVGGWATIDRNQVDNGEPWGANQDDSDRNAIRIQGTCNDYLIDGIIGANAYYHGLIAVGTSSGAKVPRFRGIDNGFRAFHMHAQDDGATVEVLEQTELGVIESYRNGWAAFRGQDSSKLNSGIYAFFANTVNARAGSLVSVDDYGNGVAMTGEGGVFVAPDSHARRIQIDKISTKNSWNGLYMAEAIEHVSIGSLHTYGDLLEPAVSGSNAKFIDSSASYTDKNTVESDGTVSTVRCQRISLPADSITNYGLRRGHRLFSGASIGIVTAGAVIWEVEVGADPDTVPGTDRDIVWVFNDGDRAAVAYTTAANSYLVVFKSGGAGLFFYGSADAQAPRNLSFGKIYASGYYKCVDSQWVTTAWRVRDISFGHVTFENSRFGLSLGSARDWTMDSLTCARLGSTARSGTVSNSVWSNVLKDCANFQIRKFAYKRPTTLYTDNGRALQLDAQCRNGDIWPIGVEPPASGVIINVLTTAGAAASGGVAGPIRVHNPTRSTGVVMTVGSGGTEDVLRTNANACYRVLSTDTP